MEFMDAEQVCGCVGHGSDSVWQECCAPLA